MGFGFHIKQLRTSAGLSIREFAEAIGLDKERFAKWEQKDFDPRSGDRLLIEKFFGMDLDSIMKLKKLPENLFNGEKKTDIIKAPDGRFPKKVGAATLVKFYETDFAAGDIEFYDDNNSITPAYEMDIPEFAGCTAFRSYGDSMEPMVKSGSILFGTRVVDWQSHLEYGQIYGIVCKDKRKYLKYIRKDKENPNTHYLLRSENKEYDDFELPKNKIKHIWLIHGWINKRN